jgi:Fic family protein
MFVATPPPLGELVQEFPAATILAELVTLTPGRPERAAGEYLHWNKLQHLEHPRGFNAKEWWLRVKLRRVADMRPFALTGPDEVEFTYNLTDRILEQLHHIDRRLADGAAANRLIASEREAGRRFLVNARMEEAIRSSQLEGATTSQVVARELLISGREPQDLGERMVANNYRALRFMREEMGGRLTPQSVLELHRIVSDGTLRNPAAGGRLQQPGEERVAVFYRDDEEQPIHRPPPAEMLPERLQLLCDFANEREDNGRFVPPVVRAILVHFWLAYDHPFEDGNGRTARILFFWMMRAQGYWLAEYLPISRLLRVAPAQYTRAFLETETDNGDTTYFLLNQLGVIERAIEDFDLYVQSKKDELRDTKRLLDDVDDLNGRQIVLLTHAVKHRDHSYTFGGHAHSHRVTHETARSDLRGLAERGFLTQRRRGRTYVFEPAPNLAELLKESGQ